MNNIAKSAQDIKRFVLPDISQYKTTWVWRIFRVYFNDFARVNYFFNFREINPSAVTASLAVPGDLELSGPEFFSYLFNHLYNSIIYQENCQGRDKCLLIS